MTGKPMDGWIAGLRDDVERAEATLRRQVDFFVATPDLGGLNLFKNTADYYVDRRMRLAMALAERAEEGEEVK